ncbi:hypothetical protein [Lujinxingia vulgaris]|uniref:hypothetical protein n=1 Tax=Lujinxingia vulgaris TaxID=2600176 RepID=UPI001E46A69F|nr:hypothetical protein [Lujinxingia vulgaris]
MCLICVEFAKERMTPLEARRALGEMIEGMEPEHVAEVEAMLTEAEEAQEDED